ncbi:MAG: autotransporter-associated beta strand repeat-containing protein [Planctomycetaceae bacterium]|nr:autotransporter-associated beta strand repeat-containing protein [Planctomycetaceae bacterium]
MKHTMMAGLAAAVMAVFAASANAADIYLDGSDAAGASSFNTGANWTGDAAPSAGNNYLTGAYTLRASTTASQTFAGDTLTVGPGGTLIVFNVPFGANDSGTILPKLYLNGATILNGATTGTSQIRAYSGYTSDSLAKRELQKMYLDGDVILDSSAGGKLEVAAQFVGAGGVTIKGNVSYSYTPLNGYHHVHAYSGDTVIDPGATLSLTYCYMPYGAGKGDVIVNGTFTPFRDANINGLYGSGIVNAPGGSNALIVGNDGADGDFSGRIQGGILRKTGAGTQILTGANTYTGGTQVNGGSLLVNNITASGTGTGAVAVNNGGTLGGSGFIGGPVTVAAGGKLSPGASAGMLTINNSLNISAALGGAAGSMLFDLGDTVTLSGASVLTIGSGLLEWDDFVFSGAPTGPAVYTLFNTSAAISGTLGTNLSGKIGGLDATLSLDGSGQDILLTVIPEPATMTLLVLGGVAALIRRRR